MKLFHRTSSTGANPKPVYLRVEDIQAIWPTVTGDLSEPPGCLIVMRGSDSDCWLAESAEEVLKACGYNIVPKPGEAAAMGRVVGPDVEVESGGQVINPDGVLILLRSEYVAAHAERTHETIPQMWERQEGYIDGLERAIEIAEGKS